MTLKQSIAATKGICRIAGCEGTVVARGWCNLHYRRWRRNGHPERLVVRFNSRPGRSTEDRFWEKVDKNGPVPKHRPELGRCWLWIASTNEHGYGQLSRKNGSPHKAHRLSYSLHTGPIPDGMAVLHECDNPACVNPAHLCLGSQIDNIKDMHVKRRYLAKARKLTDEQELELCALSGSGSMQQDLADRYRIHVRTVRRILKRRRSNHA